MWHHWLALEKKREISPSLSNTRFFIASLFIVVALLEFSTPSQYVFGYLYTGPILFANSRLNRSTKLQVTVLAAGLTLLNLFFPARQIVDPAAVANRLIAVMALAVTGWLSDRNQQYEEAIAQAKVELQTQQRLAGLREDFASTLSHDLKTPLLGGIETLKAFEKGKFGPVLPTQEKVLQTMMRSHHTTLQLVETLLDIYRNDAEGLQLQLQPVNLVTLAEDVIAQLRELSASRRVFVGIRYGESDFRSAFWVKGDILQLTRVFANLLANGIHHSPRGGRVEVMMESNSLYQVVKILDQGAGITSDELPYLFERFYQGHSERQVKGSGLGLYLSRQIIEAHGGIIWAENHRPHGALFGFRLPAIPSYETRSFTPNSPS